MLGLARLAREWRRGRRAYRARYLARVIRRVQYVGAVLAALLPPADVDDRELKVPRLFYTRARIAHQYLRVAHEREERAVRDVFIHMRAPRAFELFYRSEEHTSELQS